MSNILPDNIEEAEKIIKDSGGFLVSTFPLNNEDFDYIKSKLSAKEIISSPEGEAALGENLFFHVGKNYGIMLFRKQ